MASEYTGEQNVFQPASVTVAPGESVTWVNDGGVHNVKFEDGQLEQPAQPSPPAVWAPAPPSRTFT